MELTTRLSILDYFVFFGTMAMSITIGIFFACRKRNKDTVENYFLAGRKLSVLPTALSLVVTYQSSVLLIGGPAEVYAYGLKYTYYFIGASLSFVFAGLCIAPVFHPLKLTSVYAYFKLRYQDNAVRYLVLGFGVVYHVFYMGTVTFGTCVALEVLMGVPQWATILIYTIVTAIYTSVGGMKAVIWTDVLQFLIMLTGIFAIIIKSTVEVGGTSNVMDIASSRLQMNDFRVNPTIKYQFWNLAVGSFTMFLAACYQQPGTQRIISTPSVSSARRLFIIAGPIYGVFAFLICYQGVTIYAYYSSKGCDPLASGRIDSLNQIIPLAVADLFSTIPGLSGLFIAALSSAALSTLSSCLSGLGAVTYDDVIRELYPNMQEERATRISKIVVFLYGILGMVFTFIIGTIPGSVMNIFFAFMGCIDGPTCAIFIVSTFYRRATTKGVFIGSIVGMTLIFWLNMGQTLSVVKITPPLPAGPTDTCPSTLIDNPISNSTIYVSGVLVNSTSILDKHVYTLTNNLPDIATVMTSMNTTVQFHSANTTSDSDNNMSFLQTIYSISYMYFSLIGCLVTVIVSVLISLCTKPPDTVDDKYMFSFKKHIMEELFSRDKPNKSVYIDNPSRQKAEQMELMHD